MCVQEVLSIDKEKHLRRRLKRYLKDEWAFPAATVTEKPPTLEEHKALADLLHADRIVLQQVSLCLLSSLCITVMLMCDAFV
jgi:UDP-glucose 6-dehydrogenase